MNDSPDQSTVASDVQLTIVAPAHNEEDNIAALVDDVAAVDFAVPFEMLIVDDGSTDATAARIAEAMGKHTFLRSIRMCNTPPGKGNGQSAAFYAGIRDARSPLIALMDADRQNDPADLPAMLEKLDAENADMVHGDRSANRRDTAWRRFNTWVGRTFRRTLLGDTITDTGCSLRIFKREVGLALPLQYKGVHRFIPFYARVLGYTVVEMPVHHRPRTAGEGKYGAWNRALPGLIDLFAVRWMRSRIRPTESQTVERKDA